MRDTTVAEYRCAEPTCFGELAFVEGKDFPVCKACGTEANRAFYRVEEVTRAEWKLRPESLPARANAQAPSGYKGSRSRAMTDWVEEVHHVDGDPNNNNLGNLQIVRRKRAADK
jgi:hypothetical protein